MFFDWFVPIYFLSLSFFLTLSVCLYFSLFTNVVEALYVGATNVSHYEEIWPPMGFEPRIFLGFVLVPGLVVLVVRTPLDNSLSGHLGAFTVALQASVTTSSHNL